MNLVNPVQLYVKPLSNPIILWFHKKIKMSQIAACCTHVGNEISNLKLDLVNPVQLNVKHFK